MYLLINLLTLFKNNKNVFSTNIDFNGSISISMGRSGGRTTYMKPTRGINIVIFIFGF